MAEQKRYRYYDLIMAAFITVLLCSNLIGVPKVCHVAGVTFGGGILFFPISYLFGDILTEVYGYKRSRKVVWMGFGALIFTSFVAWVVLNLPAAPGWPHQREMEIIFGQTPRVVFASLIAYFIGELANSYTMAKMKVLTEGKWLWTRLLGSTVIGEALDSLIFYPLAFYGNWSNALILNVMVSNYAIKVVWEMAMTPLTYKVVGFLKRVEHEDYYDTHTNFSPFSIEV